MRLDEIPVEWVVAAAQEPDGPPFDRLYREIQHDLYAYLFSLLRSHDEAEDAFQETVMRLYRHLPSLKDPQAFAGWLIRIGLHACRDIQQKQSRRPALIEDLSPAAGLAEMPAEWVPVGATATRPHWERASAQEFQGKLSQALAELSPRQREAVVLFDVRDLKLEEVAAAMECSVGAVKFHVHEGRRKLRGLLQDYAPPGTAQPGGAS